MTALHVLNWLTDTMILSNISAEFGSAVQWIEDPATPILSSTPLENGDEHLNDGCPLLSNTCILISAAEFTFPDGLSINLSYHFYSSPEI